MEKSNAHTGEKAKGHSHFSYQDHGRCWMAEIKEEEKKLHYSKQSPIDIPPPFQVLFNLYPAIVIEQGEELIEGKFEEDGHSYKFNGNRIHTLQINYKKDLSLIYESPQFHFHSPSEHTFHGKFYPLEMHLVHLLKSEDKKGEYPKIAVLAICFDFSLVENPFLNEIINGGSSMKLALKSFLKKINPTYYTYEGSLKTPPLSEGVQWVIFEEAQKANFTQILNISKHWASHLNTVENNREIQPLNGRKISKHVNTL